MRNLRVYYKHNRTLGLAQRIPELRELCYLLRCLGFAAGKVDGGLAAFNTNFRLGMLLSIEHGRGGLAAFHLLVLSRQLGNTIPYRIPE